MCTTCAFTMDWGQISLCKSKGHNFDTISYLIAIVTCALSVTIFEIFTVKMCMKSTLTFIMTQDQMCFDAKSVCNMFCAGSSNVCLICHHFRDIHSRNAHDLDLDLWNRSPSNVNILMVTSRAILHLITIAMFVLAATIWDIFAIWMFMTLTLNLLFRAQYKYTLIHFFNLT